VRYLLTETEERNILLSGINGFMSDLWTRKKNPTRTGEADQGELIT